MGLEIDLASKLKHIEEQLSEIKVAIAKLQVYSALGGALAGILTSAVVAIVANLLIK